MDDPTLYEKCNDDGVVLTTALLDEFQDLVQPEEGHEEVIDVGCGPGNVTNEVLLPRLGGRARLTATDINPHMLEAARSRYPHIQFRELDIRCSPPPDMVGRHGRLFSFLALHWAADQPQAMRNVASLLAPSGRAFLLLVARCSPLIASYRLTTQHPRWGPYAALNDQAIYPYNELPDPPEVALRRYLEDAGLLVEVCRCFTQSYSHPTAQLFTGFLESINPFVRHVPEGAERRLYVQDVLRWTLENSPADTPPNSISTEMLFAIATKPQ